jgi:hypothetical protein
MHLLYLIHSTSIPVIPYQFSCTFQYFFKHVFCNASFWLNILREFMGHWWAVGNTLGTGALENLIGLS